MAWSRVRLYIVILILQAMVVTNLWFQREQRKILDDFWQQQEVREQLSRAGELCVLFSPKAYIIDHWKPRVQYGVTYCADEDAPPLRPGQATGMLEPWANQ